MVSEQRAVISLFEGRREKGACMVWCAWWWQGEQGVVIHRGVLADVDASADVGAVLGLLLGVLGSVCFRAG